MKGFNKGNVSEMNHINEHTLIGIVLRVNNDDDLKMPRILNGIKN